MKNNLNIINSIINLTIDKADLERFSLEMSDIVLGDSSYFDKYYSLDTITSAINKFKRGEIDRDYLATWAKAYLEIINGFYNVLDSGTFNIADLIKYDINEALDSLAFFNEIEEDMKEDYHIDNYRDNFIHLDEMYSNRNSYKAYFTIYDDAENDPLNDDDTERMELLFVYEKEKIFTISHVSDEIYYELKQKKSDIVKLSIDEFNKIEKELIKKGYEKQDNR